MKGGMRKDSATMDQERRASKSKNKGKVKGNKPWQKALFAAQDHQKRVAEKKRQRKAAKMLYARILREGTVRFDNPTDQIRGDVAEMMNNYRHQFQSNESPFGDGVTLVISCKKKAGQGQLAGENEMAARPNIWSW